MSYKIKATTKFRNVSIGGFFKHPIQSGIEGALNYWKEGDNNRLFYQKIGNFNSLCWPKPRDGCFHSCSPLITTQPTEHMVEISQPFNKVHIIVPDFIDSTFKDLPNMAYFSYGVMSGIFIKLSYCIGVNVVNGCGDVQIYTTTFNGSETVKLLNDNSWFYEIKR